MSKDRTNLSKNDGSTFRLWLQTHWWLLIIGLILYLSGIFYPYIKNDDFECKKVLFDLAHNAGELILIGGIIGFFSSYKMIIKPYKDELRKILFEPETLSIRKDLKLLWDNISEIIIETEFPEIAKSLLQIIKERYLQSKDNIRCYHRYDTTFHLEWDGPDRKWVRSTENAEFCVFADNQNAKLVQTNTTYAASNNDGTFVSIELIYKDTKLCNQGVYSAEKKGLNCISELELKGGRTYDIQKIVKKRFNLNSDNHICFKSRYITNGMSIKVSHPEDMKITFVSVGTIGEFKENIINSTSCEFKYNELILPRQGYIILITPIINN